MSFRSLLQQRIKETKSCVCLGIDPHLNLNADQLPSFFRKEIDSIGPLETLTKFSLTLVDSAAGKLPAVKFQSAFYEAFGWQGVKALEESIAYANSKKLITILDAKRGDISSTMKSYGVMAFDRMKADCLTVTPYMGFDVIKPLIPWLKAGKGIYLVWVSSNPTGSQIQEQRIQSDDGSNQQLLAETILSFVERETKGEGLDGSIGLVFGATKINDFYESSEALVEKASSYPLLVPGVGPQGGVVKGKLASLLAEEIHLLPMSRGLSGLGDPKAKESLNTVENWSQYQKFVEEKISRMKY